MSRQVTVELPIRIDHGKIAEFCRARGIRKLSLFGSVLRDDFDPARSDVDVLAEFDPGALAGVGFRYFAYGEELSAILLVGSPIRLVARDGAHRFQRSIADHVGSFSRQRMGAP